MAKKAGWYPDPWGGQDKRWWDGTQWTEHVQGESPLPAPMGASPRNPLVASADVRPWWQEWWFIALMLFFCCSPAGMVLLWMRRNTPWWIKLGATILAVAVSLGLTLMVTKMMWGEATLVPPRSQY